MSRFCGKCGSKLSENGLCPNCDSAKNANQEESQINSQVNNGTVNQKRNGSQNNINKPTKKEKKVKEKAEKAAAKVKSKATRKTNKIIEKANQKAAQKSDKVAARIKSKADNKVNKIKNKSEKEAEIKANKTAKKASRPIGKKIGVFLLKMLAVILAIVIIFSTISGMLVYFGIANVPGVSDLMDVMGIKNNASKSINISEYLDYSNNNRDSEEERIDAKTYYNKYSKIINEVSLDESTNMVSEEEAYNLFQSYGFTECIIVSEYTETGEYSGPNEIIPFSSNKHPVYRSDYIDEQGNVFEIYLIDGLLMTNPVSFNAKTGDNIMVAVSSSKTLKSYDSKTKTFYETMPKNSIIRVQEASDSYVGTLEELVFSEESQ